MKMIVYLRQFRLADYAVFDLAAAFLGIFLLSPFLSKLFKNFGLEIPKLNWLYLTLPISVAAHLIFGRLRSRQKITGTFGGAALSRMQGATTMV